MINTIIHFLQIFFMIPPLFCRIPEIVILVYLAYPSDFRLSFHKFFIIFLFSRLIPYPQPKPYLLNGRPNRIWSSSSLLPPPSGCRTTSPPHVGEGSHPSFRLSTSQFKWRRERDSNPRSRFKRDTRLAGEPLRPTRASLRDFTYFTVYRYEFVVRSKS